jgi:hypothetical protein
VDKLTAQRKTINMTSEDPTRETDLSATPETTQPSNAMEETRNPLPPLEKLPGKKLPVIKIAVAGVALVALALVVIWGFSIAAERDQLKADLESATNQVTSLSSTLDAAVIERDKAIEEREACSARAALYQKGSLLFSQEVQKYVLNRFYSMDSTEATLYITAGNSMPCPDPKK